MYSWWKCIMVGKLLRFRLRCASSSPGEYHQDYFSYFWHAFRFCLMLSCHLNNYHAKSKCFLTCSADPQMLIPVFIGRLLKYTAKANTVLANNCTVVQELMCCNPTTAALTCTSEVLLLAHLSWSSQLVWKLKPVQAWLININSWAEPSPKTKKGPGLRGSYTPGRGIC